MSTVEIAAFLRFPGDGFKTGCQIQCWSTAREFGCQGVVRLGFVADSLDNELRNLLTAEQRVHLDSFRRGPRLMLKRANHEYGNR